MNIVDIIIKKKNKIELSKEEIDYFINSYVEDIIPDYQVSALLMAIVLNGMTSNETINLTKAMINTGKTIELSEIDGIICDKHSTGGVGDTVSLLLLPLLACFDLKIAKMSGRGLAQTGGTLDKLESIPNFNINLTKDAFIKQVNDIGISIIGQSEDLVLADKKLYALRDVTGTVQSIPLIASSIMSKKLAIKSDIILLDIKVGNGAFMKDINDATLLAKEMIKIGKEFNRQVICVITDMNRPLSKAIGNNLEIIEIINILKNNCNSRLKDICISLASLVLEKTYINSNRKDIIKLINNKINNQEVYQKFLDFVNYQNGDISYLKNLNKFSKAKNIIKILAKDSAYISDINAMSLGILAMKLGAGRIKKDDNIDYSAGIVLNIEINDYVNKGDVIAYLHTNKDDIDEYIYDFNNAISYSKKESVKENIIKKVILDE